MTIKFGTEGWRAVMAEEFTADNVAIVAQAIADHYRQASAGVPELVIGYDPRFLSDRFARVVGEVFAGNGVRSRLSDRIVPTCAVSRYVVAHRLTAGIMITASHNPAVYNGLKVKEAFGGSATPETVARIEQHLGHSPVHRLPLPQAAAQSLVRTVNLMPDYLNGIRRFVNLAAIRRRRLTVVVDSMHGAGERLTEQLIGRGSCRVETLHGARDVLFGGQAPEPIGSHLVELSATVKRRRAHIGLATDGDADRIGAVGPDGAFVTPGKLLCIIIEHLLTTRRWTGAVVKTISNTSMINRLAQAHGLKLYEVPVGFKHVAKLMLEDDALAGGEESGGIGVRGYLPERDGIFLGLLVLEAMALQRKSLAELLKSLERRFGRWTYARRDLTLAADQVERVFQRLAAQPPAEMAGAPVAQVKTSDGVKLISADDSWLLFRRSGTEPIVRVYAESLSAARVRGLLAFGVNLVQRA